VLERHVAQAADLVLRTLVAYVRLDIEIAEDVVELRLQARSVDFGTQGRTDFQDQPVTLLSRRRQADVVGQQQLAPKAEGQHWRRTRAGRHVPGGANAEAGGESVHRFGAPEPARRRLWRSCLRHCGPAEG